MAESSSSVETHIMRESDELMRKFPPKGIDVSFKVAHTLLPSLTDVPIYQNNAPSPLESLYLFTQPPQTPQNISFEYGWRNPTSNWLLWVQNMDSRFHALWKTVGIYDSIMCSKYRIQKNLDLLFTFGEKWCPSTNTFVFPWGEATITLEDMFVLGGHSSLGKCVLSPLDTEDEIRIMNQLLEAKDRGLRTPSHKATHWWWLKEFMGKNSKIEHEAFLSLWLSRFVFPGTNLNSIEKDVFPIAIRLARGDKTSVAPAVLASIYRCLRLLKDAILARNNGDNVKIIKITAPFQLVQAWIWERFLTLQPRANILGLGQPRMARWDSTNKKFAKQEIRMEIDEASLSFLWRPYAKALDWFYPPHEFYRKNEELILIEEFVSVKDWSLVVSIRPSVLMGLKIKEGFEKYLPHRVAMQFGYDQDIPAGVDFKNDSNNQQIAWEHFIRNVEDESIYIPSQRYVPGVTDRYDTWWKVFIHHSRNIILQRAYKY